MSCVCDSLSLDHPNNSSGRAVESHPLSLSDLITQMNLVCGSSLFNELCISCRIDFRCTFSLVPFPSLSFHPSPPPCPSLFHQVFYSPFTVVPQPSCPGINMYALSWSAPYREMGAGSCVCVSVCVSVYIVRQAEDKASGDNEAAGT